MADRQIGILGMEIYFPTTFVEQADLGESARAHQFFCVRPSVPENGPHTPQLRRCGWVGQGG